LTFKLSSLEDEELFQYIATLERYIPIYMTVMEHDEKNEDILQKNTGYSLKDVYLDDIFSEEYNLIKGDMLYRNEVSTFNIQIN
jgi:hypothetical protein